MSSIWRRIGITLTLMTAALAYVFRQHILPVPLIVLLTLYVVSNYCLYAKRLSAKFAPLLIAMLAVPTGAFIYTTRAAVSFWITDIVALLLGAGLSLALFHLDAAPMRSHESRQNVPSES